MLSDPQTEEWLAAPQRYPQVDTVEDFHHNLNAVQTCIADACRRVVHSKWSTIADLPDLHWSVIGHLQTKKAELVAHFSMEFQALDSLRVAEALDRHRQAEGRSLDVFVQVKTLGGQQALLSSGQHYRHLCTNCQPFCLAHARTDDFDPIDP